MEQAINENLLLKSLEHRFGKKIVRQNFPFFPYKQIIPRDQADYLLLQFAPSNVDFFEQVTFYPFEDTLAFQQFKGAFFISTLPLITKLLLLDSIVLQSRVFGTSTYTKWSSFFGESYCRERIPLRNMEWEGLLNIHNYLITLKNNK